MIGTTEISVEWRINACRYATYDNYPSDCARVVIVPVYTVLNKFSVRIEGFATFFLEDADDDKGEVIGRFIETAQSGTITGGQSGFGAYGYKIVE